jgi:hypothetical protein
MDFPFIKWIARTVLGFVYGAALYHFVLYILQGGMWQASWVSATFSVLLFALFSLGMFALLRATKEL